MTEAIKDAPVVCERCDQESQHLIKSIGPDNRAHYLCWSCVSRQEKRVNLKETWKRGGRVARDRRTS